MSNYKRANKTAQWYGSRFAGSPMDPNVVVLHTTEGTSWPSYSGGASAPHYTAQPDFSNKRLIWRAHFPDEVSARALQNDAGGVETNTLNAVQVELIGTCDPGTAARWNRAGARFIFWPEAPDWALNGVADFLADMHERHGLKLDAPALWLPYPKSYGQSPARFSFADWRSFYGVCGHQHVPENDHGDPGALDIVRILDRARAIVTDSTPAREPARVGGRESRGAQWNMRHGRPNRAAARECLVIMVEHDLDWLILSETAEYIDELNALPGVRLIAFDAQPGQRDTAILVRDGHDVSGLQCPQMTNDGWITVKGGHTPDKWMPSAIIDGWLRIGAVHYAPSVRFHGGQLPKGPARRVASVAQHARHEAKYARRQPKELALLFGGDRNATPDDRGRWSPHWIACQAGLRPIHPGAPTHGHPVHGRPIDFPLVRGCTVEASVGENHGSDHRVVVLIVKETR